jgi:Fumarylacetoacetate (FAA) hydrolase family protein
LQKELLDTLFNNTFNKSIIRNCRFAIVYVGETGECLNGKYFWSSNMILTYEISRDRIEEVIQHLIGKDEFECIFNKI